MSGSSINVWRFDDGTPGHSRQSVGLTNALAERLAVASHVIDVRRLPLPWWQWLTGRFEHDPRTPPPDLFIGAGRRCEVPMLAARRALGGRAIYLMKPRLPADWFDLCLIPRHDGVRPRASVETIEGVLNDVVPADALDEGAGVILIGGPSRHYAWSEDQLLAQIEAIAQRSNAIRWILTNSRRTPAATTARLMDLTADNVSFTPYPDTSPEWVADQLRSAATVWVSCDSVSMMFEALTAGAAVGLITVPVRRHDRITAIAADLCARKLVTSFDDWRNGEALTGGERLAEARRCAALIAERWFA